MGEKTTPPEEKLSGRVDGISENQNVRRFNSDYGDEEILTVAFDSGDQVIEQGLQTGVNEQVF